MRIVIPGGSGHLGGVLARFFSRAGHDVVVLTRHPGDTVTWREAAWDGTTVGPWIREIEGADAVINLAGRSVNCRYGEKNLREMMESRVQSTQAVGKAISLVRQPPAVWLQMSTATIYAHRYDAPNDEATGRLGGDEADAPRLWRASIEIAKAWERAVADARTPSTRKVVLRTAMVMGNGPGGAFNLLATLARWGLGGPLGGGAQYMSWIHERDFVRAIAFLLARPDLSGAFNLAAPNPLPQREFMSALRTATGRRFALPAAKWMLEVGSFVLRTETELILKSRRVVPTRLLQAGFTFEHPDWNSAARELVERRAAA